MPDLRQGRWLFSAHPGAAQLGRQPRPLSRLPLQSGDSGPRAGTGAAPSASGGLRRAFAGTGAASDSGRKADPAGCFGRRERGTGGGSAAPAAEESVTAIARLYAFGENSRSVAGSVDCRDRRRGGSDSGCRRFLVLPVPVNRVSAGRPEYGVALPFLC